MGRNQYTKDRAAMMRMGLNALTHEQRVEAARKSVATRAAKRARMKHMQEIARAVLKLRLRDEGEIRDALREGGFADEDINYAAGIIMSQTFKAIGGDTKAAEFVRDTSGQKPVDGLQIGNLEDKPFETLNLTALSNEELQALLAAKTEREDAE